MSGARLGMIELAVGLIFAIIEPTRSLAIAAVVVAAVLFLFAFRLPQRAARRVRRRVVKLVDSVRSESDALAAKRLLEAAETALAATLASFSGHGDRRFRQKIWPWHSENRTPLLLYRKHQQASTVTAVDRGLKAKAKDEGVTRLALTPRSTSDLRALKVELRRMVQELQ